MTPTTRLFAAAIVLPLALAAPPAAAQHGEVVRDAYTFLGSALDVDVATEAPGRIRFIRGGRSRVEVSGRALDGFATAALATRRLTLTSLGADRVDFIVVVPEHVRVSVRFAGSSRTEQFGSLSRSATFTWDPTETRPAFETIRSGSAPSTPRAAPDPQLDPPVRATSGVETVRGTR